MAVRGEFCFRSFRGHESGYIVTLTDEDQNWLAGRLTEAMTLIGEEAGKGWKAVVGAIDDDLRICAFYARESNEWMEVAHLWT